MASEDRVSAGNAARISPVPMAGGHINGSAADGVNDPAPSIPMLEDRGGDGGDLQYPSAGPGDFPSLLTCPINMEPPAVPVTFDVPNEDGVLCSQVFEYSALYRAIYTKGVRQAYRKIRHTITGDWIRRDQALALVKRVPPNLQAMIAAERVRLGLSIDDDEPVGPDDQRMYREMMERIQDP